MKVKALMAKLKKCDGDAEVKVAWSETEYGEDDSCDVDKDGDAGDKTDWQEFVLGK